MPSFIFYSLDKYESKGNTVYTVENPIECSDFSHLIGKNFVIDGTVRTVIGVERYTHLPPWKVGELIGVMVTTDSNAPVPE